MADNYLGNRMDDYLAGKLSKGAPRRLTPSGAKPGTLMLPVNPKLTVWIGVGALSEAGIALIQTLTAAGIKTLYRAQAGKIGAEPAIKFGAKHYPPSAPTPPADIEINITPNEIQIGNSKITFTPSQEQPAAIFAATLLSLPSTSAEINLKP